MISAVRNTNTAVLKSLEKRIKTKNNNEGCFYIVQGREKMLFESERFRFAVVNRACSSASILNGE